MPPPCPSSWLHVWLSLCYQSLLIAAVNLLAHWKRGIRSMMWAGKLFGTLYHLLCKHVTGCKSTFGPGCILIKHYRDLENQTGCSFSIIAKWRAETETQAKGHLRTTGIWPCTSWGTRGLLSLHSVSYPALAWRNVFKSSYLWSSHCIFHLHIYKHTWDLRRWKVWQNNIGHVGSFSFIFQ